MRGSLIFVLSIPLALLVGLRLVNPRRWGRTLPTAGAAAFSDRAYSALKRGCLAWAYGMLAIVGLAVVLAALPVSIPFSVFGGLWVLAIVGCLAWGALRPRVYGDGVNRVKNGARIGWGLLFFALSFIALPVYWGSAILAQTGFGFVDNKRREHHVTAERFDRLKFAFAEPVASRMIPKDATDITFNFRFGLGMGLGADADMKCRVSRVGLARFAEANGYEFQSDSIEKNACPGGAPDCDWIHGVYEKYVPPRLSKTSFAGCMLPDGTLKYEPIQEFAPYPEKFLAYNYRYASCGGYSFLYDVERGILYADWASN